MAGTLTRGLPPGQRQDVDLESVTSFASGPVSIRPTTKYAWSGNSQVDHDTYHRMVEEYRAAKAKEGNDELKIKQLAAQLARTEEAAKRALIRTDQSAKGTTAQQLLDAQRKVQQLQAENSELSSKLAREKKRANDFRSAAEENRRRLEAALREQRALVRKIGETERSLGGSAAARSAARKAAAEQEYWSEEAGRRFAVQQEELVNLRAANHQLQQQLAAAVPVETATHYESSIKELQQLVRFYEKRLTSSAGPALAGTGLESLTVVHLGLDGQGCCGTWVLEPLTEAGACYLLERSTGRLFSDVPDGQWPRPVGLKPAGACSIQLGVKGRLDSVLRGLSNAMRSVNSSNTSGSNSGNRNHVAEHSKLLDALHQVISRHECAANSCSSAASRTVDLRDLPALLAIALPGCAHKELAELQAWMQLGSSQHMQQQQLVAGQQGVPLEEVEAAARDLLAARDAVCQGRGLTVNEVLLRVRRLLRGAPQAVAAAFEEADGKGGSLGPLQLLQLLRQQQLLPDLTPQEARYLLVLLHEWDLTAGCQHNLTDLYAALQLLKLVRVAPGTSAATAAVPVVPAGGERSDQLRPDSRQSCGSSTTNTPVAGNAAAQGAACCSEGLMAGISDRKQKRPSAGVRAGGGGGVMVGREGGSSSGPHGTLKEAFLKERVAALEQELVAAKASSGAANDQQVEALRADVARYQARLAELENDFLSLDVVTNTDVGDYDAEMRKAWFTAAAFKKRYVEHKLELDSIKATAEKMQATLDETHRALHAEAARRMAMEEAAAVARLESSRAKELAAAVAAERGERMKLEKDYLELQSKAFAAPGGALAEVRVLREELLAVRRERALGEAREAELRREIAVIKRQLEGISPEEHRRLMRELAEVQRKAVTCELELRAALDKLELYRRAEDPGGTGLGAMAATTASSAAGAAAYIAGAAFDMQPDEGKSEPELRAELSQMRQAMALEAQELGKLRTLLDTEAAISLEAKAALEEAQAALQVARAEAAQQLAKLQRELDHRDEAIRKLEQQLKGAYQGLNRAALRASSTSSAADGAAGVRVSRVGGAVGRGGAAVLQSSEEVLQGLRPGENMIEITVADATLMLNDVLGPDTMTFLAWDFFLHDSQATPLVAGSSPVYSTTVQYIVEADVFLLEYLMKQQLALELFEARGWDAAAIGLAHVPLKLLLQDLEVGAALGMNRAWHHVDIIGSKGQQLGRLRLGFRVAKPLDKLLLEYKQKQQHQGQQTALDSPPQVDPAVPDSPPQHPGQCRGQQQQLAPAAADRALAVLEEAALQADADPGKASHLLVTVHRCEGLVQQQQQQQQQGAPSEAQAAANSGPACVLPAQRPYVHYRPPGRSTSHDTAVGGGPAPVFEDAASWALMKGPAVEEALQHCQLQVAVFDDAVQDPSNALLGLAAVPLAPLAGGVPVQGGVFDLLQPSTGAAAGRVWISICWHNPLLSAAVGNKQLKARVPLLQPAAMAAADAPRMQTSSQQQSVSPLHQQQQQQLEQQQQHEQQPTTGLHQLLSAMSQQQQQQAAGPYASCQATGLPAVHDGVDTAAAAAVAAALNRQQKPRQPMLLHSQGVMGDPAAAMTAAIEQSQQRSGIMLLRPDQQFMHLHPSAAASHRYAHSNGLEQSIDGLPVPATSSAAAVAPAAALSTPAAVPGWLNNNNNNNNNSNSSSSNSDGLAVMRQVSPAVETWGSLDTTIYLKVEGLTASDDALRDPSLQHVMVAHMFCEDFTSAAQQCTATVQKRPGFMSFNYAVAYSVADPLTKLPTAAGQVLGAALAAADAGQAPNVVLPLLLASSQTAVVADFSQVDCVATCEVDLSDIWRGASGDISSSELLLVPSPEKAAQYTSAGVTGQLRVTFIAARALATLRHYIFSG